MQLNSVELTSSPEHYQYKESNKQRLSMMLKSMMMVTACLAVLLGLPDFPQTSILLIDAIFSYFCSTLFRNKYRILFLLHPLMIGILSLGYTTSFLSLGDGLDYQNIIQERVLTFGGISDLIDQIKLALFIGKAQYLYLGVAPVFIVPEYLYGNPDPCVYYLWQSTFHVILMSLSLILAKKWSVIREDYLLCFALYAIISPSFFELGCAPTRHYVTFFSVWLFYLSFSAIMQQLRVFRVCCFILSVILIVFSKAAYLIPISLYVLYYCLIEIKVGSKLLRNVVVVALALILIMYFPWLLALFHNYDAASIFGGGTFSSLVKLPILGLFIKFIYALLSPFPWHKASEYIPTLYGGNFLQFVMHLFSSLTGIYFFTRLALYGKQIFIKYRDVRSIIMFGLIMSLSIMAGAIGYHGYLSIFFPFFAPLFSIKKYQLTLRVPLFIAIFMELTYFLVID